MAFKRINIFGNFKIGGKITGIILLSVILITTAIGIVTLQFSNGLMQERYGESLNGIADLKAEKIESYFNQVKSDARVIQELQGLKRFLYYANHQDDSLDSEESDPGIHLEPLQNIFNYKNVLIADQRGQILYVSGKDDPEFMVGQSFNSDKDILKQGTDGISLSKVYHEKDQFCMWLSAPLIDKHNSQAGYLLFQLDLAPIYKVIQDTVGLGQTGETLVGKKISEDKIVFLNPLRHDKQAALTKFIIIGSKTAYPIQQAVTGETGTTLDLDYRDKQTLATWRYIPVVDWGMVNKMDVDEIRSQSFKLIQSLLIIAGCGVLFALLIALTFSHYLVKPMLLLKASLNSLAKGILPNAVINKSRDEIGQMAGTVNDLVQSLRSTAGFAHKIGEGDFAADYKPLSDGDTLGNALLSMRDSLQEATRNDDERNWIVRGVADVGEILRNHDNLEAMGEEVITCIIDKINAVQGAFYTVEESDEGERYIEMKSSYAYDRKKYLQVQFKFAQGLVGQAAAEKDIILRTEIPHDYVTVTSGLLGEKRPTCILIVPLITNDQVYGVLEFAGFNRFTDREIKLVQEINIIIARTIFNIQVSSRTKRLLEESQDLSNELQERQNELQQNAEEMEATQEELKRTNKHLGEQVEEVENAQKRMQLVLENASEIITIYESDRAVRYISPSIEKIMGYSQDELVGKKELIYVQGEERKKFNKMFKRLINTPEEPVKIAFECQKKNGESVWLETTGVNLLADPAIKGIVINALNITERRRAEQEERMRSKMQALSENSLDLITRMDDQGNFFYINPTIESYTGKKPEHYLHKEVKDVGLDPGVREQWLTILKQVAEQNDKVAAEMNFPSIMGDRIMQVNAIPEFTGENGDSKLESVLVVSHDITERKLIELDIQDKNKKITESINYARRIQGAILPDTKLIQSELPGAFILYKAKDVVSGDFPWHLKVGDDIYLAAVDCTGHGVPGALISLIGYFLLNDIVRSRKITDPGKILDSLDEGVTKTLRQDRAESKAKDGMDIALCKINPKKGEVEYAGAHRPLYLIKNGKLEEIKGNRFPIGGGKFRNQTNFGNTKIKVKKGDSIHFCSDGFPDQFGGPDNRKFGPKKIRELITKNHSKSAGDIHQVMKRAWENWKGDGKQTDDMLMIGVKF